MTGNSEASNRPERYMVFAPDGGRSFDVLGMTVTLKRPANAMRPEFTLFQAHIPPHFSALTAHFHREMMEWLYVLAGTVAFTLDDETVIVGPGGFVMVLPGTVHAFWNPAAEPAVLLGYHSRGDDDDYLTELVALMARTPDWPPADDAPFLALAARFDRYPPPTPLPPRKIPVTP